MVRPRPMITTWRPSTGHIVRREQLDDAGRRARQRARGAHDESAQVGGVQAVHVLGGIDRQQDPLLVEPGGQRELDEDTR